MLSCVISYIFFIFSSLLVYNFWPQTQAYRLCLARRKLFGWRRCSLRCRTDALVESLLHGPMNMTVQVHANLNGNLGLGTFHQCSGSSSGFTFGLMHLALPWVAAQVIELAEFLLQDPWNGTEGVFLGRCNPATAEELDKPSDVDCWEITHLEWL